MNFPWAKRAFTTRTLDDASGQEIVEAAFVLPIVFLLLIGIYWFGLAYNIYSTINHAATQGARLAAAPSACTSCLTGTTVTASQVANTVTQALAASHIDPTQIGQYPATSPTLCSVPAPPPPMPAPSCQTSSNVTFCQGVELNAADVTSTGAVPICGVSVSFQYPFNFSIPFTSVSQIQIKANVQMQEEN
jgi:Flp pilus assembly protein TadG